MAMWLKEIKMKKQDEFNWFEGISPRKDNFKINNRKKIIKFINYNNKKNIEKSTSKEKNINLNIFIKKENIF